MASLLQSVLTLAISIYIVSCFGPDIFATNNVTYGQDYLYLQCRIVLSSNKPTAVKLTVYRNMSKVLQTDFSSITWNDDDLKNRSCSEAIDGACAKVLDIQISKDSVSCTDTGLYQGMVEFSDDSNSTAETYIEVKVVPDKINPIKLLSGQNDSIPLPDGTALFLLCSGNVGDPPKNIHWCIKRSNDMISTVYDHTEDISTGTPTSVGCQYTQTSNLTYVVTDKDSLTTLRCYAGDIYKCNDNLIPHQEYTVRRSTVSGGHKPGEDSFKMNIIFLVVVLGTQL